MVRILEVSRDIEMFNAELYRYYAELFASDPEISRLWIKTAMEEENHMEQINMAIKLRNQGMIESVKIDLFRAENTLRMVKNIYDGVRLNKPKLIDAFRSAIKLEEHLNAFHMANIAVFADDACKRLFQSLMHADRQHLEMLETAYKKALTTQSN
jgi:rubrerythrin